VTLNCWKADDYIFEKTNLSKAAVNESPACGSMITDGNIPKLGSWRWLFVR